MTTLAAPNIDRPTDDIVDVLIIGAGASGAVVAASLAETRMKILCLEQGEWSLLGAVRDRPRMWRDVDGGGR